MSIQDDIFDVQHALKRKPDYKASLERILNYLYYLEEQNEEYRKVFDGLLDVERAILRLRKLAEEA